jgi:hypothetical protein
MTSIVVWAGVDTHGPASLYIASDSRISWGKREAWDRGRKVFSSASHPHIFGYWGDVLFPALAIPVIIDRIDRGILTSGEGGWHSEIRQELRMLHSKYPNGQRGDFGIVHGFRSGEKVGCAFSVAIFAYDGSANKWISLEVSMPHESAVLRMAGTGIPYIRRALALWQSSKAANTSRAVFSAFCESIAGHGDPHTEGPPQLGGLYRIGPGRLFGVIYHNQRYFAGAPLRTPENPAQIEWRNRLFERMDGSTKKRISNAQRHEERE